MLLEFSANPRTEEEQFVRVGVPGALGGSIIVLLSWRLGALAAIFPI
jgi:hypothetical protein